MKAVFDVYPVTLKDEIIYVETNLPGLGTVVTTAANITALTNAAAAAVPNKPITYQSDFSKGANVVATAAGVVAAATVWFPPAAIIAGVVGAAAALLGKIFANSKAKKYAAERGQFEQVNAQIKFENNELDRQYVITRSAVDQLRARVNTLSGIPSTFINDDYSLNGLGSKKSSEKNALENEKELNAALIKEQESKTKLMASLLDEYNKLMKALLSINETKSTNDWLLWILGGGALVVGAYYAYQNRTTIKKELSK